MHLTLGVLALKDSAEVARATATLAGALEAAGEARGGVRVKLVGLKTFERRGVLGAGDGIGGRGGRGRSRHCAWPGKGSGKFGGSERQGGEREGAEEQEGESEGYGERGGGGVVLDQTNVSRLRVEKEEAQETEDANANSGSGGGGPTPKRAWKQEGAKLSSEALKSEPQNDYENCRVLWVEPRDANTNASAVEPGIGAGPAPARAIGEEEGLLSLTCCSLRNHFLSQDLLSRDRDNDKLILHMTVLNATYAEERRPGRGGRNRGSRRVAYNVSQLVESFKDIVWAEDILFDKLELMRMGEVKGEIGSEREGESWYESVGAVSL